MPDSSNFTHLAVALDGAGWHPAAWRAEDARPDELFSAGYWADLVAEAEHGALDFVTIEDSLTLQSDDHLQADDRGDRVRGVLDAVLIAARIAPRTKGIGLVPTAIVTHTEPFHVSKSIATLDYVSTGRAGVRVQISARHDAAAHFGRRNLPALSVNPLNDPSVQQQIGEYFTETADYVEVLRRLWDSWEDEAEIRDVATGRFIDRDKLHYIDFDGRWFSVKGPSITPRHHRASRSLRPWGTAESHTSSSPTASTSDSSPRTIPRRPQTSLSRSGRCNAPSIEARTRCTSSVTWWCSSITLPPLHARDGSAATTSPAPNTTATLKFSSELRRGWRTCCRSGTRRAYPVSGYVRPRCRMT